ncbi:MAG: hypothetical protein ACRCVT_06605, partial [Leadbetterella sp.]
MIKVSNLANHKTIVCPVFEFEIIPSELTTFLKNRGIDFENYTALFSGKAKQNLPLIGTGRETIYLLGLGKDSKKIYDISRHFFYNSTIQGNISVFATDIAAHLKDFAKGTVLASYRMDHFKKERKKGFEVEEIEFFGENLDLNLAKEGEIVAKSTKIILQWMDFPANHKTPLQVAKWMQDEAISKNISITVHNKQKCEEMGFHALLAVGKGSKNADPCMVEIHYKHPEAKTKLGFVGKGVT